MYQFKIEICHSAQEKYFANPGQSNNDYKVYEFYCILVSIFKMNV